MSIVSSVHSVGHAQADGRAYVIEVHTDHVGGVHRFEYLAAIGANYAAIRDARVPEIEARLANEEMHNCIGSGTFTTVHLTGAQFAALVRALYRASEREALGRIAAWISNRIAAGDFTDAQLRSAFGMTVQQYNDFKARMIALRDHWLAVQAAVGE
jgi:hypothetical protein